MTEADLVEVARETIIVMIKISAPALLVGLVVGLVISLFQAVTQIQEATLTFVPKVLAVFASIVIFLPFMIGVLRQFWLEIMDKLISGFPS